MGEAPDLVRVLPTHHRVEAIIEEAGNGRVWRLVLVVAAEGCGCYLTEKGRLLIHHGSFLGVEERLGEPACTGSILTITLFERNRRQRNA